MMRNDQYILLCIASFFLHKEFYTSVAHEAPAVKRTVRSLPGCPAEWIAFGVNCYGIFGSTYDKERFYKAKRICNQMQANLVSIHNQEEQNAVRRMIIQNGARDTWIGLSEPAPTWSSSRNFHWSDNSPLNFTAWREGEPSSREEPCVHMWFREEHNGKWNDVPCSLKMQFICQVRADYPTSRPMILSEGGSQTVIVGDSVTFRCNTEDADEFPLMWRKGENEAISSGPTGILRDDRFEIVNGTSLHITEVQPTDNGVYTCVISAETPIHFVHVLRVTSPPSPAHYCQNKTAKWIDSGGEFCYIIELERYVKWIDAVYECYKEGGSLASFHSSEDVKRVLRHLKHERGQLHIGLLKNTDGSLHWVDNSAVDYRNWERGKPNSRSEQCVDFNTESGKWRDISCNRILGYICSSLKGGSPVKHEKVCPGTSSKWNDFGGELCYILEKKAKFTWHEAAQRCADEGGSLGSFRSIEEVSILLQHTKEIYRKMLHIGLQKNEDGEFEWVDKRPYELDYFEYRDVSVYYRNESYVSERCAEMNPRSGQWNDVTCDKKNGYICSVQKVGIGISSLSPPLSANFTPNTCGGDIISDNGTIHTLNYPENYNPFENCLWKIIVPENYQVALNFHTIEVEYDAACKYDYIEVNRGPKAHDSVKFCGVPQPQTILSSANIMYIKFVSDAERESVGFLADFTKVELCGGNIVSEEGVIQTRNYPENYLQNDICMWKITVPDSYKVLLKFHTFEIEEDTDCRFDYVEVFDGHDSTSQILGRFCGSDVPDDIISSGHKIMVKFASDNMKEYYGFYAEFKKTIVSPENMPPFAELLEESGTVEPD